MSNTQPLTYLCFVIEKFFWILFFSFTPRQSIKQPENVLDKKKGNKKLSVSSLDAGMFDACEREDP